jgi:hypothetical protein
MALIRPERDTPQNANTLAAAAVNAA